jgi:hypothetical protein
MGERIWTALDPVVADGLACVLCGRDFLSRSSRMRLSVGRSQTDSQVFACVGDCADLAGTMPEVLVIPEQALTVGGMALLRMLDRAGGDPRQAWHGRLVAATVRTAAPLVVAAELRRIAAQPTTDQLWAGCLRARADELDPAGGER